MQVERYRIVLTGWVLTGYRTEDVAAELSKLFKIPKERVWPLLAGEPSIIRRNLTMEKAERLRNKIERRGAVCVLKKVLREESDCLLTDQESTGILEPDLNMDLTQMLRSGGGADSAFLIYRAPEHKVSGSRRRKRILLSVFALSGLLVVALIWNLLTPLDEGDTSSGSHSVFTFSPAKSPGFSPAGGKER